MKFYEGQKVTLTCSAMGIETCEPRVVLSVNDDGVWLDNGSGNDPDGPYDPSTGQWVDNGIIVGASQFIT